MLPMDLRFVRMKRPHHSHSRSEASLVTKVRSSQTLALHCIAFVGLRTNRAIFLSSSREDNIPREGRKKEGSSWLNRNNIQMSCMSLPQPSLLQQTRYSITSDTTKSRDMEYTADQCLQAEGRPSVILQGIPRATKKSDNRPGARSVQEATPRLLVRENKAPSPKEHVTKSSFFYPAVSSFVFAHGFCTGTVQAHIRVESMRHAIIVATNRSIKRSVLTADSSLTHCPRRLGPLWSTSSRDDCFTVSHPVPTPGTPRSPLHLAYVLRTSSGLHAISMCASRPSLWPTPDLTVQHTGRRRQSDVQVPSVPQEDSETFRSKSALLY